MAAGQQAVVAEVREVDAGMAQRLGSALEGCGVDVVGSGRALGPRSVVVWSLPPTEEGLEALGRAHPQLRALVLVDRPGRDVVSSFLGAGAQAVLDRQGSADTIANAAVAVARGYLVLPSAGRRALLPPHPGALLTVEQLGWLQDLAQGLDVAAVADRAGCSERELYRRLRGIYDVLQVPGRAEALQLLRRAGLLERDASVRR